MMDKNQIVGFALLLLILIGWSYISAPTEAEIERQRQLQDSLMRVEQVRQDSLIIAQNKQNKIMQENLSDSLKRQKATAQYGDFAEVSFGEVKDFTLENEKLKLSFSNKGGRITSALLKEHKKVVQNEAGEKIKVDLKLLEDEKNKFEYLISTQGRVISTQDLVFQTSTSGNKISFKANAGDGGSIEQIYTLGDAYTIDYQVKLNGLQNTIDRSDNPVKLNWINYLDKLELNDDFERIYSTVYFKESEEDSDYCSCTGDDNEDLENNKLDWISHVQQFFNTSIIPQTDKFDGGQFETNLMPEDDEDLKKVTSIVNIPYDHAANASMDMKMYIGPNEFEELRGFENKLEEIIPFGRSIFGSINRWFIRPFFGWLSGFIGSKGIVIIVLIFIIKMALYPLMYKMLHSQAKMGALKPELEHLKAKHKDEPQKIQMETMKIYREYGVSPLGGCMPMVVQMPIWYALFRFFPASITFRQESFLWADDLSSYDVFFNLPFDIPFMGAHISLFTILWAIATLIYTFYNTRHMDMSANPAMKYVQYFMPLMFLGFFNSYASGLTCYMLFSTLFNIAQTVVTKKFVFDDEKIKAELKKSKDKPKKPKSGFQAKLEEAMKQQQETARKQQSQRKTRKKK